MQIRDITETNILVTNYGAEQPLMAIMAYVENGWDITLSTKEEEKGTEERKQTPGRRCFSIRPEWCEGMYEGVEIDGPPRIPRTMQLHS